MAMAAKSAEQPKSDGPFVRGVTIEKSIAWGTEAWWLGQRSTEQMTHRWTCYIRSAAPGDEEAPPGPEDQLGTFVKKVVFRLHSSFTNPTRGTCKPNLYCLSQTATVRECASCVTQIITFAHSTENQELCYPLVLSKCSVPFFIASSPLLPLSHISNSFCSCHSSLVLSRRCSACK